MRARNTARAIERFWQYKWAGKIPARYRHHKPHSASDEQQIIPMSRSQDDALHYTAQDERPRYPVSRPRGGAR